MENQATKDFYLKIDTVIAPANHADENDTEKKISKPTIMARGFEADATWKAKVTPAFSKWNRKILPGDTKAGAFWAYLCAVKYVVELHKNNCVGVFLYIQTSDKYLHKCQTEAKTPFIANKGANSYRYYANKIAEESGLTISWKLALLPEELKEV